MALACLLEAENSPLSHSQFTLLAQAALTIDSIFGETTLATIQTICGIIHYFYFSGTVRIRTEGYGLIGLAMALSQGVSITNPSTYLILLLTWTQMGLRECSPRSPLLLH